MALLLAVMMLFALAACGNGTEEAAEDVAVTEEPIEAEAPDTGADAAKVEADSDIETAEDISEPSVEMEASAEPPADSGDAPTAAADCDYFIDLERDGVASADIALAVGETVTVGLNYTGMDSTVAFEIQDISNSAIVSAEADVVTITITGQQAGTSTVIASWTAVNTSGSVYDVELNVTVQ